MKPIRRSYTHSTFYICFPIVLACLLVLLATASPTSAQVSASPGNAIMSPDKTMTFTIDVTSGTTLGSVAVLTFGAPNLDFTSVAAGTTCPNVVSGACTVEVQFQPTTAGRRQGAVLLNDPAGNTLLSISLDGASDGPEVAFGPSRISVFAGGGTGGVGGLATSARLGAPTGIAEDGFGNYYVADPKANAVYKISPAGVITTFAGTGTAGFSGDGGAATSAELNGPMDVIVDGAGFVYISDTNNNVVRMVTTAGVISTYAGQYYKIGSTPPSVCAAATNSVGDGCPGNQIVLATPVGLVFCHAQNLHIADKLHNMVRTIDRIGYNTFTQVGDGTQGYNGDGELNTSAELNGPMGLDMDAANYIYVADSGNHIIRKTLLTGTTPNPISTVAGIPGTTGNSGDGGSAIDAELNSPFGVKVDPAGDIYIADSASQVVREVNVATGMISTIAGASAASQLNDPSEVWVNEKGNLYVVDTQNAIVREFDVADAPSLAFTSSGVGITSASQDVTVANLGSGSLNISKITTAANFSIGGADTSCNASGSETLNPAASCVLGIVFTPTAAGSVSGSAILADNATPATQTIGLMGAVGSGPAAYSVTAKSSTMSMSAGGKVTATLNLSSSTYSGMVTFTTSVTSTDGTPADITATATPVSLSAGGTGTSTLTITSNTQAADYLPSIPWNGTTALFCALLLMVPFTLRRRAGAFVLLALAICAGSAMMACGGTTSSKTSLQTRTYVVTATPTASVSGSVTVSNPAPVSITVTVQ